MVVDIKPRVPANFKECKRLGHTIYETSNGLWWCKLCHERTDKSFAEHSRRILEAAKTGQPIKDVIGYFPGQKSSMANSDEPLYPQTFTISLGSTSEAQKRRGAYERAAQKAGNRTVGEWAREQLDAAANYKESKA